MRLGGLNSFVAQENEKIGLAIANGQKPTVCGDRQFSGASSAEDYAV
jgi:hypothetical protein